VRILSITFAIATAALAGASSAAAVAAFGTPDNALYCGVSSGEPPTRLICWRAKDGYTVSMTRLSRSTGEIYSPNRGSHPAPGRKLQYGKTWSLSAYWTCLSHHGGLTCVNRAGHGWWLGRLQGSRLF
jgi:hypothetical protein